MMLFMLLFSRQGKLRLQKWYVAYPDKVKKKITRELITTILARYSKTRKKLTPVSCSHGYESKCRNNNNAQIQWKIVFYFAESRKCVRFWNGKTAKSFIKGEWHSENMVELMCE